MGYDIATVCWTCLSAGGGCGHSLCPQRALYNGSTGDMAVFRIVHMAGSCRVIVFFKVTDGHFDVNHVFIE